MTMNDDKAREVLAREISAYREAESRASDDGAVFHAEGAKESADALTRAVELFDEVQRLRDRVVSLEGQRDCYARLWLTPESTPPTTAELRAEAERLAQEVWGDGAEAWAECDADPGESGPWGAKARRSKYASTDWMLDGCEDEHAALRALVAALREIRRGDAG